MSDSSASLHPGQAMRMVKSMSEAMVAVGDNDLTYAEEYTWACMQNDALKDEEIVGREAVIERVLGPVSVYFRGVIYNEVVGSDIVNTDLAHLMLNAAVGDRTDYEYNGRDRDDAIEVYASLGQDGAVTGSYVDHRNGEPSEDKAVNDTLDEIASWFGFAAEDGPTNHVFTRSPEQVEQLIFGLGTMSRRLTSQID